MPPVSVWSSPSRREGVHGLPGLRTIAHPKLRSVVIQTTKPHAMQKRRQAMSSISILLTRNLQDVFGENDPGGVGGPPSTKSTAKMECSTILPEAEPHRGRDEIGIASRARSGQLTLTFGISQLPNLRNWAMAGGSSGYRVAPVRRPLTPGLISSLSGTAGLPPFISFSTSYPERPRVAPFGWQRQPNVTREMLPYESNSMLQRQCHERRSRQNTVESRHAASHKRLAVEPI